mgnify:FL=1
MNVLLDISSANIYVSGTGITVNSTVESTTSSNGAFMITNGGAGINGNVNIGGVLDINNTTAAVSNSTGSFVTAGGGGFNGDVYANDFYRCTNTTANLLVYGSNFNYVNSTASSAISSTVASIKLTMTTGNLEAGTYLVQPSYKIRVGTATRTGITELYKGNTNGTLIHSSGVSCPTVATDFVYQNDNVVLVLAAGVQTFLLRYRCTLSTYTTTIADARLLVYRVL